MAKLIVDAEAVKTARNSIASDLAGCKYRYPGGWEKVVRTLTPVSEGGEAIEISEAAADALCAVPFPLKVIENLRAENDRLRRALLGEDEEVNKTLGRLATKQGESGRFNHDQTDSRRWDAREIQRETLDAVARFLDVKVPNGE